MKVWKKNHIFALVGGVEATYVVGLRQSIVL